MQKPVVYLAGLISTTHLESLSWRAKLIPQLEAAGFDVRNPLKGKQNLLSETKNGGMSTTSASCKSIVSRDFGDVIASNVILVNLNTWGSQRPMIGTFFELGLCLHLNKAVVAILDNNSYLRQHPFIQEVIDEYFETEEAAIAFLKRYYGSTEI